MKNRTIYFKITLLLIGLAILELLEIALCLYFEEPNLLAPVFVFDYIFITLCFIGIWLRKFGGDVLTTLVCAIYSLGGLFVMFNFQGLETIFDYLIKGTLVSQTIIASIAWVILFYERFTRSKKMTESFEKYP